MLDVDTAPKFQTVEEAVAARDKRDVLKVTNVSTDKASGMTSAEVVDNWDRTGTYELFDYRGHWYLTSGSGCAAY